MKINRGAADMLAARAQREGRPVTVTFQVTDRCNYECVHCYQEHRDPKTAKRDELSLTEIIRILDELAEAGVIGREGHRLVLLAPAEVPQDLPASASSASR